MTDTVVPGTTTPGRSRSGPFLGRVAELEALGGLLADPDVDLVVLTGPVGVGKSRLAVELAHRWRAAGDLVVHVPLEGVRAAGLASDAVIAAAGAADATTPAQALWRYADGAPVLLVLDDADGVDGLADLVLDLLETYPALTVLVTAIRPLRMRGERVLAIRPFTDGDSDHAVALFAARAAAADASFVLDEPTRAAVAGVCSAVGGLPLAIELAAARVTTVPPTTMATSLARSSDLLRQGTAHGVPERHRSIDAALDWSFELLCERAQSVLVQLSVFEGAFPLDAALQVVSPRRGEPELLDDMSELVDAHLVDLETPSPDVTLFRLDPLVRRRARRLLSESDEEARVRDAHADYWAARCRVDGAAASRSWPDVLAALDRQVADGQIDAAMQLAVIASAELEASPGARASLLPRVEGVLDDGRVSDDALAARSLMWATIHSPSDDSGAAAYAAWTTRRLKESLELARSSGDDSTLLEALELIIISMGVTFDIEAAVASAHEGYAIAVRHGDEALLARFETYEAMAFGATGQPGEHVRSARSAYERGLRVGEDVAVVHCALMLYAQPPEEQGPVPLLGLDELLVRAERRRRPTLVLHVLAAQFRVALMAGDDSAAASVIARMLLICEGLERTWPTADVGPLMLVTQWAVRRGDLEDAVRIRESMAPIEQLLPSILPQHAPAYLAAVAPLPDLVGPERYAELAAEVAGSTLRQANRRAQAMVRAALPPPAVAEPRRVPASDPAPAQLTPRERDVLAQLVAGGTNREIGEALGMTPKTVMHHTVAIYRKLGVRGRAEAVAWALRHGG